jgi:PAS domain S-box-containing protein
LNLSAQIDPELLTLLTDGDTLYHSAPCGYFSCLPDGRFVKVNRTLLNWLKYSESDILGAANLRDLFSKGGQIYYQMFHYPLIEMTGQVNELSYDIYRKDGSFFPALVNSSAVRDAEGKLRAINIIVTDITDRKKYEAQLLYAKRLAEEERKEFEFVADFIPEMIWTAGIEGKVNYVNKRLADHFALTSNNNLSDAIVDRLYSDGRGTVLRSWISGIKGAANFQIQLRMRDVTGKYEWYLLKGVPYTDSGGLITKWLGSCLNVNAHVMELERKDEFISIASHELKTPITTLKATLQLLDRLKGNDLPEKFSRLIDQANRSMSKVGTLVAELLNVNRLNAGQIVLNKTNFSLSGLLDECCQNIRFNNKHHVVVSGDPELIVFADEHRIDQVVTNFINNAVKYAPSIACY